MRQPAFLHVQHVRFKQDSRNGATPGATPEIRQRRQPAPWQSAARVVKLPIVEHLAAPAIDDLIATALQQHRRALEQIVRERIQLMVDELVTESLNGHLNGDRDAKELTSSTMPSKRTSQPPKVCRTCGKTKPLDEYETGRGTCRACRRDQERERAARKAATKEPPRPTETPATSTV